MIPYELAKQLKEAGFPFSVEGKYAWFLDGVPSVASLANEGFNVPTLSELIEACGNPFLLLQRHLANRSEARWEAGSYLNQTDTTVFGPTPEIAVAQLYLALNPKNI